LTTERTRTWLDHALDVDGRKYFGQAIAEHLLREADGDCLFRCAQAEIVKATGVSKNVVSKIVGQFTAAGLLEKVKGGYRLTLPGERPRDLPEFRMIRNGWPEVQSDREAEIVSTVFERADWAGHCPRGSLPEEFQWTPGDFRALQRLRLNGVLDGSSVFECLILPPHSVRSGAPRAQDDRDGEDNGRTCGINHRASHRDVQSLSRIWRQGEARSILRPQNREHCSRVDESEAA
jgi:hypothetical protein